MEPTGTHDGGDENREGQRNSPTPSVQVSWSLAGCRNCGLCVGLEDRLDQLPDRTPLAIVTQKCRVVGQLCRAPQPGQLIELILPLARVASPDEVCLFGAHVSPSKLQSFRVEAYLREGLRPRMGGFEPHLQTGRPALMAQCLLLEAVARGRLPSCVAPFVKG